MLQETVEFVRQFWDSIWPWTVLEPWQKGLILRRGEVNRPAKVGMNWHWPVIETVSTMSTAITPIEIGPQSLISKDNRPYVINVVATVRKVDPKICLIDIGGSDSVIADCVPGVMSELGMANTWDFIKSKEHLVKARMKVKDMCAVYGHELVRLSVKDLSPIRSYRLMQTIVTETHKEKEY